MWPTTGIAEPDEFDIPLDVRTLREWAHRHFREHVLKTKRSPAYDVIVLSKFMTPLSVDRAKGPLDKEDDS